MAYDVTKTDGTRLALVEDRKLDTSSSIKILGRNYPGYGEVMAENLVQMLEHFANEAEPVNPIDGQIWWSTLDKVMYVYTNGEWVYLGGPGAEASSGVDISQIQDTEGAYHQAIKFKVAGVVVAIISAEPTAYTPEDTALALAFPSIGAGINLNYSDAYGTYKLRGRALEAEFADLAEIYRSDCMLTPGDVVTIGGAYEITLNTDEASENVFGVISTEPGLLLNASEKQLELHFPVALAGKVPCKVVGQVKKGQRLVSSHIAGVAVAATGTESNLAIIGRALEDKNTDVVGLVKVVVGAR